MLKNKIFWISFLAGFSCMSLILYLLEEEREMYQLELLINDAGAVENIPV